jgi:hypothetical protein
MSPAHCDKNPSDFQGRGTAFIATKPRPTSRVVLRQKTVRLPGIRQLDIATSRPTSRDSTWEHRKNGHFLNCGEQTNDVRVVASHGVQGLEQWEDGGHVAMVSLHNEMSQQQPTSERTGTPPTSTEQDVVVEPALKLAAQSHRKDPHTGRLGHGRCRRPIMLAVREAIGMLSEPHQADRTVSPLQDTSTYPRDRLTHENADRCWAHATYAQRRWKETKRITDLFTAPVRKAGPRRSGQAAEGRRQRLWRRATLPLVRRLLRLRHRKLQPHRKPSLRPTTPGQRASG